MSCHKQLEYDQLIQFDIIWVQTNRQTDKQNIEKDEVQYSFMHSYKYSLVYSAHLIVV